jgi:hypothetical protein
MPEPVVLSVIPPLASMLFVVNFSRASLESFVPHGGEHATTAWRLVRPLILLGGLPLQVGQATKLLKFRRLSCRHNVVSWEGQSTECEMGSGRKVGSKELDCGKRRGAAAL